MSNLRKISNAKDLLCNNKKNIVNIRDNKTLKTFSIEDDSNKKLKLDYLYFGYLGILNQINEDEYIFEQLPIDPISFAYKDKIETAKYLDRVIVKQEQYRDCFNGQVYNSYYGQLHTIENNQLIFAPLILLSYYLPVRYRIKNQITYEEALVILEYLNDILSGVNFNDVFSNGIKTRFYPERIYNISKIKFEEQKPSKNELLTDVNTNAKVLKKYQIIIK